MAPRANTATPPTHSTVASDIQRSKSLPLTPLTTTGARFRPITATTAPVTTGGISRSIQRVPAALTISPISTYSTPQAMIPPSATGRLAFGPPPE